MAIVTAWELVGNHSRWIAATHTGMAVGVSHLHAENILRSEGDAYETGQQAWGVPSGSDRALPGTAASHWPGRRVCHSGDLTTADGGLLANGVWSTNGASVWYQVSNIDADSWFYEYEVTISGSEGDLSHIILETSQNADIRKLIGDSSFKLVGPTTFGDEGNSNPGIPGEIYGIKLDELTEMTFAFSFESYNGPIGATSMQKTARQAAPTTICTMRALEHRYPMCSVMTSATSTSMGDISSCPIPT